MPKCQKAKMTFQCFTEIKPCYTHILVRPYFSQLLQKLALIILGLKLAIYSAEIKLIFTFNRLFTGLINMSQIFFVGGVTCKTWSHCKFLQILYCISTGEMYYTYILCSKLSSKHACDTV